LQVGFDEFLLVKMCLLTFDFLNKLSLSLELFPLDFELVEQLLTLSLFFLYLVSGTFKLT
jgi:hypothetical protein